MNVARADRPIIEENDSRDDKPPKRLCQKPVYKSVNKIKTVMDVSLTRRCSGLAPIEFQLEAETYWEQIIYSNVVTACSNLMNEIKHVIDTLHGGNCWSSVDSSYVQIYCDLKMEEADTGIWMMMSLVEVLKTNTFQGLTIGLKVRWAGVKGVKCTQVKSQGPSRHWKKPPSQLDRCLIVKLNILHLRPRGHNLGKFL